MKLHFQNPPHALQEGLAAFLALHGIKACRNGTPVTLTESQDDLVITKAEQGIICALPSPGLLFRALTIIKAHEGEACFCVRERRHFQTLAAMFDGSQASSLMTVASVKRMLLYLAGMGYNMLMLYCEDCFELSGEPYWGNMRPRYTKADFRELDGFAASLGIEMVPCVQTLAHLSDPIKRPPYAKMADTASVLMVGDERVYALIDKIVGEVGACFKSRRIHIGMDEAWDLGLGNHLKKHGYVPSGELVKAHLARVMEIVRAHGLSPMMWADMFFRARSPKKIYKDYDVVFEESDKSMVPEGMHVVYWDYYQLTAEGYENMLGKCQYLCQNTVFAGCARNVRTFATHNNKTLATTAAAMAACKQRGVREVIATVWGDDHRESSNFAVLLGLQCFAEHAFGDHATTEKIRARVTETTGMTAEAFDHIDELDRCEGYNGDNIDNISLTRAIIWQDPLLGLFDNELGDYDFHAHYAELEKKLTLDAARYPLFANMFHFYAAVARVCATKAGLGRALTAAYRAGNKKELDRLCREELVALMQDLSALRTAHRTHFFEEYKAVGWEILDIRYGGALARLDTAKMRLTAYLAGKLDCIEELEEARLPFGETGKVKHTLNYHQICSASRL
ncbi:MAG: family 20 glycosylhydrolase [Clostridia bacterium]|nr:family 20 glycosylhydrolase [Clostridia bacterium]